MKHGQLAKRAGNFRRLRPELLLSDLHGSFQQRFRASVIARVHIVVRHVGDRIADQQIVGAQNAFANFERAQQRRTRFQILAFVLQIHELFE